MNFPESVKIVEVGPRDGLQNEPQSLSLQDRITLIKRLSKAGITEIEAGSFVSPKWIPQMAETDQILASLPLQGQTRYPVLVPNMRGLEGALAAGARDIAVFGAASETFSKKNINCSIAESLERFRPVCESALERGLRVRGYISCVLGCPYESEIPPDKVARIAEKLIDMGCYEVSLGDTIGVGTPVKARDMLHVVSGRVPIEKLAIHFHDTYGQALANIYACLESGVETVDCSVAGVGGCPYAKGASGNVSTEDVLYMLNGLDIETGVEISEVVATAWWISDKLGRLPVSRVARALGRPANYVRQDATDSR